MKAEKPATHPQTIASLALGAIVIVIVYSVTTSMRLPYIASTQGALTALAVLGFVMCAVNGLSSKVDRPGFSWTSPFTLVGIALGLVIIYILVASLTNINLPFISNDYEAFLLLAAILFVKWVVSHMHGRRLANVQN